MKYILRILISIAITKLLVGCQIAANSKIETRNIVENWVAENPTGVEINISESIVGFEYSCMLPDKTCSPTNTIRSYSYSNPAIETELKLVFDENIITTPLTVNSLTSNFSYLIIFDLDLGLKSQGWDIKPLTPTLGIKSGISFLSISNEVISFTVDTVLHSIMITDTHSVACAGQMVLVNENCHDAVVASIPLKVNVTVPFYARF